MPSKLRVKAGPIEFEYEGDSEFSIDDVKDLFSHIETLFKIPALGEPEGHAAHKVEKTKLPQGPSLKLHIATIASRLSVKTGPDLAVAAAASLQLVKGKESVTRQEIIAEMKEATAYFKENMIGNLTGTLNGLVKNNRLNAIATDTYALTAKERETLGAQLEA